MTQVAVRVPDDVAEEWRQHAEDSGEYSSLSDLIRRSVTQNVRSGGTGQPGGLKDMQRIEDRLSAVEDVLNSVENGVDRNHSAISEVREHVRTEREKADDAAILDALPVVPPDRNDRNPDGYARQILRNREAPENFGTPQYVAAQVGAPLGPVRESLEELAENIASVGEIDGRYYRRE